MGKYAFLDMNHLARIACVDESAFGINTKVQMIVQLGAYIYVRNSQNPDYLYR